MPLYEHVFLARQDVSAQQVEQMVEQYKALIAEYEGTVGKVEAWGLRTLTYRVKKNRKAHYTLITSTHRRRRSRKWNVRCASTRTSCAS